MASAREVRAAVRAQLAEQLTAREDAALSVAASWRRVQKARERLAAAEAEAGAAVSAAVDRVPINELAILAGIPASDLRRLSRATKAGDGSVHSATGAGASPPAGPGQPVQV